MNTIASLKWRYATKKFSDRKVSAEAIDKILESINLSASSTGLQPYRIVVVENPSLKESLAEGSFNTQIATCSHLLVFAAFTKVTIEQIDAYMQQIAKEREIPLAALEDFKTALVGGILSRLDEENAAWAARQAYIALGTALISAAELKIDSTPMEGFDAKKFDSLLNLESQGLTSVVTLALGYRDEQNDVYAALKKVRLPITELVSFVK
ncbi:nitroreductase family protein [Pedobacter jeongneungensis]|uniref:nitroreductase family protein n=1 Tax=Pedobacter jeongneungensis TaxID=947309 RepID=UPI0004698A0A|nr:nitroreductase family protein [Pedobacter jeongneungensis]